MKWSVRTLSISGLVVLFCLTGCEHLGNYVWVDDYKPPAPANDPRGYVIVPGDVIDVRVFNQDAMSRRARVRADGKVSLPFLNDVQAAGYTPVVLSQQLQTRLKDFINNPVVTVSLEEVRAISVSVMGEVARAGVYNLEPGAGVLQAIASAGGFNEFAKKDRIFVLRSARGSQEPTRIRFTYRALSRAEGNAATFTLEANDIVVVE